MSNEDGDGAHSSELKAPSWLAPGGHCISRPEQPPAKAKASPAGACDLRRFRRRTAVRYNCRMRVISLASILLLVPSVHAAEARIPKTTVLTLALDQELEGKKVKKGKEFKAHLSEPVTRAGGQVIIPAGSELKGRIEDADERHLTLKFKEIKTPSGKKSIEARLVGVNAENVKVEENELESPGKSGQEEGRCCWDHGDGRHCGLRS
jgi:hypothetical protein